MSNGNFGTFEFEAWQGEPEMMQVIVGDITPKNLVGSVYAWEQYRAPISEIKTWTNCTDVNALTNYQAIFKLIGTVQTFSLTLPAGNLTGNVKIIRAKPLPPHALGASSDTAATQIIECTWSVELGE